ncbi:hypothetical protein [Nocardia sp. SSK8]|uniref:hypothetical protein n=1 Tax=Nocardia sp. SSK8 TaxID=3120154 RepID=UPI00300A1E5E
MGTEGDENDFGEFGPPLDDASAGFGGPIGATPPPAPGALPERGWQPAAPPAAPGPFGPPAGAPNPFGAPVSGAPPVAPPPGPPVVPPGSPVTPPGPPVGTPPPAAPPRGPRSAPISVFGDAVAAPPPAPPQRDGSPFGDSVPVASGRELTEVIRRDRPASRPEPEADIVRAPAPETVRMSAPETTRAVPPAPERPDEDKAWWNSPDDDGGVPKPPAEPGLSWADDPIARRLAPKTPTAPVAEQKETDKRVPWLIGGAVAAVLIVVALVAVIGLVKRGGDEPGPTAAPTTSVQIPGFECPASTDPAVTVSNGPGDTSSGARAILGFQYAFYVDRSGAKVRDYASPDGDISQADRLQRAIDTKIPVGAKHCVKIRETAPGVFDVDLSEWHPDGEVITYPQVIITTNNDGKWQVKHILTR